MRKDWEVYSIKDLGKVITGSTPSTKDDLNYSSNDYSFVKPSDIPQNQILYIDNTECYVSEYAFKNSRILPSGTVLVTCIGIIGKVGITKNDCICNQQINAIIPNDKVNNKFLAYSIFAKREVLSLIANSPVVPIINKNDFSNIKLQLPTLQTQQQIVEELDSLTSIIEKHKKQLEELDTLAQSIFYDMFGDPITNEKGWETSTIDNVCSSIIRGPFGSALKKEFFVEKGDSTYKVYEQKNAINKNALIGTYYISTEMYKSLSRFEIFPNDIIMSCSGTIGELFVIPFDAERGIINQALLKFTLNKKIEQNYFLFMMNLMKSKMDVKGCGIQNIGSVKYIKATMFGLPPLALQQQFASKIEAIEKQKELIKQSLSEVQQLFDSRMDYYFG